MLYVTSDNVTYFDSLGVEYVPTESKNSQTTKISQQNTYRIKAYDSIMCGYLCIGFIDFMFNGKSLLD